MNLFELRKMLDSRKIGVYELVQEYIDKINKHDTILNSYITVCHSHALDCAKYAQNLIDNGKSKPLTGIPMSVKDNICTSGIKTTCGSRMLDDFIPVFNATAVTRLNDDGFILLGKTNMDEFAMGSTSQTSYYGGVKNPHNTDYKPGGSSGGAAAAVAAGLCAAALGSDTGGSVCQPSAFCGVTGLKPTYGTVSRHGLIAFASSFDQIGIIANCAFDTGYILNSIYGKDGYDATVSEKANGNYTSCIGSDISKLKIGVPHEFLESASDEIKSAVLNATDYYKSLGCEIIDCSLPSLEYAVSAYYLISSAEAASNLSRYDGIRYGFRTKHGTSYDDIVKKSRNEGFGDEVKRRIMLGNYALRSGYYDEYYNKARKIQAQLCNEYSDIFKKCDVILTPTSPTSAYKLSQKLSPTQLYSADICTVTSNITGLPSISTTCGYTNEGMPIGMSITGKAFDEKTIIAVCDRFEKDFDRKECTL